MWSGSRRRATISICATGFFEIPLERENGIDSGVAESEADPIGIPLRSHLDSVHLTHQSMYLTDEESGH
jgi:hypothetical protein